MPFGGADSEELAVTNAAIMTALLEMLIHKKVVTRGDVRGVLADAVHTLEARKGKRRVKAAIDIISDILIPRFSDK
jgi:hypothetical protein